MMFSRKIRHFAALAAAFGIALQALWPIIAQARPGNSISVPVCSAEGTRHSIELPLGKNQTEKSAEHCKLCVLGDGKGVALVAADFSPYTPENHSNLNPETLKAFFPEESPNSAHPRAPPQVS
jgi:hypothetical protein